MKSSEIRLSSISYYGKNEELMEHGLYKYTALGDLNSIKPNYYKDEVYFLQNRKIFTLHRFFRRVKFGKKTPILREEKLIDCSHTILTYFFSQKYASSAYGERL